MPTLNQVSKIQRVILSCTTYDQLKVAKRMLVQQAPKLSRITVNYLDSVYADKLAEITRGTN